MDQYLLSVHSGADDDPTEMPSPEEMRSYLERIAALEQDMDDAGVFVFGGALKGADAAMVVRGATGSVTDGPFIETKEHIAGFYIINAADVDTARTWANRVSEVVGKPIEVRPFAATGRVQV
ncbi:MAG: hypothetical protein KDB69_01355 [Acidimicrobiia bacterium]|nr:hypothetical protein [Acidimicrobiia bacterium]